MIIGRPLLFYGILARLTRQKSMKMEKNTNQSLIIHLNLVRDRTPHNKQSHTNYKCPSLFGSQKNNQNTNNSLSTLVDQSSFSNYFFSHHYSSKSFNMGLNIKYEEEFILNARGSKRFTCRWLPEEQDPKALVLLCHGYAMETSISYKGTATRLAKAGYGVYGIDYVGHGKSDGLRGYIPSFNELTQDCNDHFSKVCEKKENKGRQKFLMGESMGGAVILMLHKMMPDFWDGAILIAPMCKIADDLKPNPLVVNVLKAFANVIPTWRIVPSQDIIEAAVRDPERKKEVRSNPYWYTGRPRLKTANELVKVTTEIEKNLHKVKLPFLVIHGGDDKVTDPAISKLLYDKASSSDKAFKLYAGMWHALTYGELPENIDTVFKDVIEWLDERSKRSTRMELGMKSNEDRVDNSIRGKASI